SLSEHFNESIFLRIEEESCARGGSLVFVERWNRGEHPLLVLQVGLYGTMTHRGQVPKRPKGADCKSAGLCLPRFESLPAHQIALAWVGELASGQAGCNQRVFGVMKV